MGSMGRIAEYSHDRKSVFLPMLPKNKKALETNGETIVALPIFDKRREAEIHWDRCCVLIVTAGQNSTEAL
jgi:hypothetical protein